MTRRSGFVATALTVASLVALAPSGARADQCKGVTMPPTIDVEGNRLVLNGMGAREATVFNVDVYVAGLYLPERTRDAASVLDQMRVMRMSLELVRDVERGEMNEAIREGFQRNAGGRLEALRPRIAELERLIPDLGEGDKISFTFRPDAGGVLAVHVNGRLVGRIEGEDFARAFFSIWLGNRPPNAELKRGLLGGAC